MKNRAFATLIGLLLLLTPACKKADPQTAQQTPPPDAAQAAQDTAAKPEANAPEAQPAAAADPAGPPPARAPTGSGRQIFPSGCRGCGAKDRAEAGSGTDEL